MIKEFKNYLATTKRYSQNTVEAYGNDLVNFVTWIKAMNSNARWSTITPQTMQRYAGVLTAQGLKATTVNRRLSSVKALLNYCVVQGMLKTNPLRYMQYQKQDKNMPNVIDPDELERAINGSKGTVRIMLLLLARTGMRLQEMLEISQTDLEADRIRINGKGKKQRYVYMKKEELEEVRAYITGRGYKPFEGIGQRQVRWCIYETLRHYCHATQLSPHAIRHTFATQLAAHGAPTTTISTLLGHEKLDTAQRYINTAGTKIREQYLQFS